MRFGQNRPREIQERRRSGFLPRGERLEARQLMAIDLVNIAGTADGSTDGPYGVLLAGQNTNGGAGRSVAEVGDVNGDGFNDFVIGEPTVVRNGVGEALGAGPGRAYLVFGSAQVNGPSSNWLDLVTQQRVGNLSNVGNATQNNPLNGAPGYAFDGLTFNASQNPVGELGASVAGVGDVNGDGFADFMIGAPGGKDSSGNNNNAGRAYLVYGGSNLVRASKSVDFDNPTANTDLSIITFVSTVGGFRAGRAVSSAADVIPDGNPDIAIGAPRASVNGLSQNGAAFVVSGVNLRLAVTQTIVLQNVGQATGTVPGIVFAGASSNDFAGFALSPTTNVSGVSVNLQPQTNLLIGAPQFDLGAGVAYMVYGTTTLAGQGTVNGTFRSITLNRIGSATNGVAGAAFTGDTVNDRTGYSVASAGDFNADGLGDIMIGSPGFAVGTGRVNVILGRAATPSIPGPITGTINLSTIPAGIANIELDGSIPGSLAGFAITPVSSVNNDSTNEILIGAPGFGNFNGIAYLIPGNPDLQGVQNLSAVEGSVIQGLAITLSSTSSSPNFFGSSVSGRLSTNAAGQTIDADNVGDFLIGSSGYAINNAGVLAGSAFVLEGAFIPLPDVVSTAITSPIGVGGFNPPYSINATSPADLQIFILSAGSNTPGFAPFADINPATIAVNGVPLPDPSTFTKEPDLDGDGIPDASFVFSPRSLLALANGTVVFTVSARTSTTGAFPNRRYTGTVNVTVTGGGGGGGGGLPSSRTVAFGNLGGDNSSAMPYGERLVPTNNILRRLRYKAIPPFVAHRQFLPTNGFGFRFNNYFHPQKTHKNGVTAYPTGKQHQQGGSGVYTLGRRVLSRGKFPNGIHIGKIKHKGPTIP